MNKNEKIKSITFEFIDFLGNKYIKEMTKERLKELSVFNYQEITKKLKIAAAFHKNYCVIVYVNGKEIYYSKNELL